MFRVSVNESGSSTQPTVITLAQALKFFPNLSLRLLLPTATEPPINFAGWYKDIVVESVADSVIMDPSTKRYSKARILPMPPMLINNPSISITPTTKNQSPTTLPKQPPVSTISRITQGMPVSSPVSVVPVKNQESAKCNEFKETKNSVNRNSPNQISNKQPPVTTISRVSQGMPVSSLVSVAPAKNQESAKCNEFKETKNSVNRNSPNQISNKQPPVSTISRVSQGMPVSSLVSVAPAKNQEITKCNEFKETKNSVKRNSPNPISNKPVKMPKLITTELPKRRERKADRTLIESISKFITATKENKLKNIDSPPKPTVNNAFAVIPSTSSSAIRVSQETTNQPPIKELSNLDVNCNSDSSPIDFQVPSGVKKEYQFGPNGKFKTLDHDSTKQDEPKKDNQKNNVIVLLDGEQLIKIDRPDMANKLRVAIRLAMKEVISKEELDTLTQNAYFIQSPELERVSETKDVLPTNSKSNPVNHNNVSNIKNMSNNQNKSQKVNQQQPCTSKLTITKTQPLINNKQTNSSNTQQTIKQNDLKHNVSSVQHPMATITQIQSANKQTTGNQQPTTSKNTLVSFNSSVAGQKVISLLQSKPVELINCSKCDVVSEDEVCTSCRMSSQFKGVTVTRIDTPSTPQPTNLNDPIEILSSSDSEDEFKKIKINEPTICKKETKDNLKKYIEKLRLNPTFLDEKVWSKDIGIKDFFKIEKCNIIQIGNYETVASGDVFICLHGIRMTINNLNSEPVTVDLHIENITKMFGYYTDHPLIIFYTNHLAAVGIQFLLNMNDGNKKSIFDPLSEDFRVRKIVWSFDLKKNDKQLLEKLMLKLPKEKYEPLTSTQAKDIRKIIFPSNRNEPEVKPQSEMTLTEYENVVLLTESFNATKVDIKVYDYNTLNAEEFLNDKLVEFHLNYWYKNMLSSEDNKRTYVFSTYFYSTLAKKKLAGDPPFGNSLTRFQRVQKWTKNINIFQKDFIFIPINENYHWYIVVICYPYLDGPLYWDGTSAQGLGEDDELIDRNVRSLCDTTDLDEADGNTEDLWFYQNDFPKKSGKDFVYDVQKVMERRKGIKQPCILILDSLSGGVNRARIAATLRGWLYEEYRAKHNGSTKDFSKSVMKSGLIRVPQQGNYYDCGLFVMHFFEKFFLESNCGLYFPNNPFGKLVPS
ncbi:uncharacterized protein LOC112688813 isoform X3 [Sipha flava]|uniref:Uncharacterized protein LOC112688813 isoform X3 n=1 Tax=Sipha flava TaxID=143950 RepID=A0A8B8G579_9HEMI|nr:uncharacterized protein LOC112688813 isoform X3 [Sipha flava]